MICICLCFIIINFLSRRSEHESAEVLIPKKFTSNGRKKDEGSAIPMQYLQHSTHSPEKDKIWNGDQATFKGKPKYAQLYVHKSDCTIQSWKATDSSLTQLQLTEHKGGKSKCSPDSCCAIARRRQEDANADQEDAYVDLASKTCKGDCDGKKCHTVERLFPGSYVWFSIPEEKELDPAQEFQKLQIDKPKPVPAKQFLDYWNVKSQYGPHSFIVDIRELINNYRKAKFVPEGRRIVLRCGGTLLYKQEVCYVVIITFEGDGIHDKDGFPPINSANAESSAQCKWSPLLNKVGCYKEGDGYPTFTAQHRRKRPSDYHDHIVFAVYLPDEQELSLPKESLVGGGPLDTEHHAQCHRFRKFAKNQAKTCTKFEAGYNQPASSKKKD